MLAQQNSSVQHNVSGGVIVSNQSLAVQRVRRSQAGSYACAAANTEGDARSQDLNLVVQCQSGAPLVINVQSRG
jgi:hypothetical protein